MINKSPATAACLNNIQRLSQTNQNSEKIIQFGDFIVTFAALLLEELSKRNH